MGNFGVVLCIWSRNQTEKRFVTSIIHVITSHQLINLGLRVEISISVNRPGPFNLRPSAMVWSLDTSCTCSAGVAISWVRIAGERNGRKRRGDVVIF